MAFKLAPKDEVKTKVVVEVLGDLGKIERADFVATFRKLPTDQVRVLTESIRTGQAEENDVIAQNVVAWDGVKDVDGQDLPFNTDNLHALLNMVEARKAMAAAFWSVQIGEAIRKN